MKITELKAYKRINAKFETGEFTPGTESKMPVYSYDPRYNTKLTPGHYVDGISYVKIHFKDVPEEFRTRDFFLKALSSVHKDILEYVKEHIGTEFDRKFFMDYIATNQYALEFDENCFEYMPLEYIDEEMVSFAILQAVKRRYIERRGDFGEWFYSVAKRKPEILTEDFWVLGARLWAKRIGENNKFLSITPDEYKTQDYYFAMCLLNSTPVMEDFPDEIVTAGFLSVLIYDNINNVACFSEKALETKFPLLIDGEEITYWQLAVRIDGYLIRDIPLNEERIEYFLRYYPKDSGQYRYGFENPYKRWLEQKQQNPDA